MVRTAGANRIGNISEDIFGKGKLQSRTVMWRFELFEKIFHENKGFGYKRQNRLLCSIVNYEC